VRQRLVFEIADGQLDDGVLAVLGLDCFEWVGAVCQKREVAPVGPELGLGSEQPGAPDDQALLAERRLGDLCLARLGVVDQRLPGGLVNRGDRRLDVLVLAHTDRVGPARGLQARHRLLVRESRVGAQQLRAAGTGPPMRGMSSSTNRSAPRAVLAEPLRARMCSTSPVPARVARIG
jgi:hypothetical protein